MDKNAFTHDATPTWSGFLYQGRVAVYLALEKIISLVMNDCFRMLWFLGIRN